MLDTRQQLHANPNKKMSACKAKRKSGGNILAYEPLFSLYLQKKKRIRSKITLKIENQTNLPRETNNFPLLHNKQRSLKCMT